MKQITELFQAIDAKSVQTFLTFLDNDCQFKFANLPEAKGINAIGQFVEGFFSSIKSLKHQIEDIWGTPEGAVCHGTVTYIRFDDTTLTVPFANVFYINGNKITRYQIFADTSQLYS